MSRAPKTLPPRRVLCHTGNTTKQHFKHQLGEMMTTIAEITPVTSKLSGVSDRAYNSALADIRAQAAKATKLQAFRDAKAGK